MKVPSDPTTPVPVETSGTRLKIGEYVFEPRTGYEFPVAIIPYEVASRLVRANARDREAMVAKKKRFEAENKALKDIGKKPLALPEFMEMPVLRFAEPVKKNAKTDE